MNEDWLKAKLPQIAESLSGSLVKAMSIYGDDDGVTLENMTPSANICYDLPGGKRLTISLAINNVEG